MDAVPEIEADGVERENIVEAGILEEKNVSFLGGADEDGGRGGRGRGLLDGHHPQAGAQSQTGPLHLLEGGADEDAGILDGRPAVVAGLVLLVFIVCFSRQNFGVFDWLGH